MDRNYTKEDSRKENPHGEYADKDEGDITQYVSESSSASDNEEDFRVLGKPKFSVVKEILSIVKNLGGWKSTWKIVAPRASTLCIIAFLVVSVFFFPMSGFNSTLKGKQETPITSAPPQPAKTRTTTVQPAPVPVTPSTEVTQTPSVVPSEEKEESFETITPENSYAPAESSIEGSTAQRAGDEEVNRENSSAEPSVSSGRESKKNSGGTLGDELIGKLTENGDEGQESSLEQTPSRENNSTSRTSTDIR